MGYDNKRVKYGFSLGHPIQIRYQEDFDVSRDDFPGVSTASAISPHNRSDNTDDGEGR